ncbi:pro-interleukin-16-like [Tachypleus tridentatus]|uniref:pro-interleukin-16-like n=1 Tax=Tachypleus tridentatus TaxID=6853 RepID=UPI003FCF445E
MLEEANRFLLEEPMSDGQEVSVVVIQRKSQVGSVGITLAGGADYEVKEVTIHKVIAGSLAERNGQIKKGDRVLSINGCNLKGLTHQEALDILKAPRNEIVLVLARKRSTNSRFPEPCISSSLTNGYHSLPNKLEQIRAEPSASTSTYTKEKIITVELQKDKTGIGFSLDGGKNSPVGDRPLTIKKVFKGGDTDRLGLLKAGDEILSLNNQTLTGMTRTEAWNFMKKLPEGQVSVTVKQR